MTAPPEPGVLTRFVPSETDAEDLYLAFEEAWAERGIEPFEHQEQALEAIAQGHSVVLNTPTGSGKTEVALAALFCALARGRRSAYTAPTKALVNQKFFALCRLFGSRNVGLMTGDATVNADAWIVCCTTEVLRDVALREGEEAPFRCVVLDELHFLYDPRRGMAWWVPLLELRRAQHVLMSATLAEPEELRARVERLGRGRPCELVPPAGRPVERPVELHFEYLKRTTRLDAVALARRKGWLPAYVVCFDRRSAFALAEQLKSTEKSERRDEIRAALRGERLTTPFGKKLGELLKFGVGVHHAGMLPRYKNLVERLAEARLLNVICGTTTLGVGIDMPLKTVIFSALSRKAGPAKFVHVRANEFQQIAGRAGRFGMFDEGFVVGLEPEHEVKKESPPEGFRGWNEETFRKLCEGTPKVGKSTFRITGPIVLNILVRRGDGRAALDELIERAELPANRRNEERKRAEEIVSALEAAGLVRRVPDAGPDEPSWALDVDLDRIDRPGSLYVEYLLERYAAESGDPEHLDPESPAYALEVLTAVESILENPRQILWVQQRDVRSAHHQEWIALQREREPNVAQLDEMQRLDDARRQATYPRPMAAFLDRAFDAFLNHQPWVEDSDAPRAKSVARDMFEHGDGFVDYVKRLGITNEEGSLLRYLNDASRVLARGLPRRIREREDVADLTDWLDAIVRAADASLAEEWERLEHPERADEPADTAPEPDERALDVTLRPGAFRVMVRTAAFRWIQAIARGDLASIATSDLPAERLEAELAPFLEEHGPPRTDADARGPTLHAFDPSTGEVAQTLADPDLTGEYRLVGRVDREASRAEGRAVLRLERVERLGAMR